LTIGRTYRYQANTTVSSAGASSIPNRRMSFVVSNGSDQIMFKSLTDYASSNSIPFLRGTLSGYVDFVATATNVTFRISDATAATLSNNSIYAARLCELPESVIEVTSF